MHFERSHANRIAGGLARRVHACSCTRAEQARATPPQRACFSPRWPLASQLRSTATQHGENIWSTRVPPATAREQSAATGAERRQPVDNQECWTAHTAGGSEGAVHACEGARVCARAARASAARSGSKQSSQSAGVRPGVRPVRLPEGPVARGQSRTGHSRHTTQEEAGGAQPPSLCPSGRATPYHGYHGPGAGADAG